MAADVLPDAATNFGKRARRRLRSEQVIWFTSVGADGTPQPNPVWFWWEDGEVVVYCRPDAHRLTHIEDRPQVALHFDGNSRGGDVVVLKGTARRDQQAPPAHEAAGYAEKYHNGMARVSGSPEAFSEAYSEAVRVEITRVRGF